MFQTQIPVHSSQLLILQGFICWVRSIRVGCLKKKLFSYLTQSHLVQKLFTFLNSEKYSDSSQD